MITSWVNIKITKVYSRGNNGFIEVEFWTAEGSTSGPVRNMTSIEQETAEPLCMQEVINKANELKTPLWNKEKETQRKKCKKCTRIRRKERNITNKRKIKRSKIKRKIPFSKDQDNSQGTQNIEILTLGVLSANILLK